MSLETLGPPERRRTGRDEANLMKSYTEFVCYNVYFCYVQLVTSMDLCVQIPNKSASGS